MLVVVGGVALAHALGLDGGMEAAALRLPGQFGKEAVAGNAGQSVVGKVGAAVVHETVIFGLQPAVGQVTAQAMDELLLDTQLDTPAGRTPGVGVGRAPGKHLVGTGDYLILDPSVEHRQIQPGAIGAPFQPDLCIA